jgi:hypothetical protein
MTPFDMEIRKEERGEKEISSVYTRRAERKRLCGSSPQTNVLCSRVVFIVCLWSMVKESWRDVYSTSAKVDHMNSSCSSSCL